MVIHTKEKAKIHAHEPKGAKIKDSNIYTVERGPKTIGAKISDGKKKSYRKSTIHQSESKNKGLSRFKRNYRECLTLMYRLFVAAKAVDADLSGPEEEREADDRMEAAAIVAEDKGAYPADREGRTR